MSLAINRILLQHSEALEQANKAAADAILVEVRAILAPFNFSRHQLTIVCLLMVNEKGCDNDRFFWEYAPRGAAVRALHAAGDALTGVPDAILNHLRGEVL